MTGGAAGVEVDAQRCLAASRDAAAYPFQLHVVARQKYAPQHRLAAFIGERELERRVLLRQARAVADQRVQYDDVLPARIGLEIRRFDAQDFGAARQSQCASEPLADGEERRARLGHERCDLRAIAICRLRPKENGRDRCRHSPDPWAPARRLGRRHEIRQPRFVACDRRLRGPARRVEQSELRREIER